MSNLLQKASIITTPTAYDTGKILSVKPVETYGPELVTNGDFATDSDWTKGTGTTISLGAANFVNATAVSLFQDIGTQSGSVQVAFSVTNYTSGTLNVYSGLNQSVGVINVSANALGTYTAYVDRTGGNNNIIFGSSNNFTGSIDNVSVKEALNADFDFTRNSSATRVGSNGLIQTVASNIPRIDYTGGVGSWKFEPQRTNSVSYSEAFSNSYWAKTRASITSNSTISPDGTLNASKLIEDTANGSHFLLVQPVYTTSSVNNVVSLSLFAKKSERDLQIQSFASGGGENPKVNFNLTNGTSTSVGSGVTPTFSIQSFGNDWFRCTLTYTVSQSGSGVRFYISMVKDNTTNYQGDGSSGFYIWGAQFEVASYPTSYIRSNSGSATTRLADVANNAGSSNLINSTEGVLYAEISALANDGSGRKVTLNNGSNSQVLVLEYTSTSNQIRVFLSNGSLQFNEYITISDLTEFNKIAIKYKVNDFAIWVNGIELATDTSGTTFSSGTLTNVNFDDGSGNADFYGNTKSVAVFKEALTDLELECLVSWMSFSDLGINFGYTVE